jgi:hypothetical protein
MHDIFQVPAFLKEEMQMATEYTEINSRPLEATRHRVFMNAKGNTTYNLSLLLSNFQIDKP